MDDNPWLVITPDARIIYVYGSFTEAHAHGRVLRRTTHWELHQNGHLGYDGPVAGATCETCVATGWQPKLAWV